MHALKDTTPVTLPGDTEEAFNKTRTLFELLNKRRECCSSDEGYLPKNLEQQSKFVGKC